MESQKGHCAACAGGPEGIAGHDAIFVHEILAEGVIYRCRMCGSLWGRRYIGEGAFEWLFRKAFEEARA